ncbi:hypothetical protein VIOR3934_11272 [Vibrio orientalis CIP 102891 = ATCC 33934]|uniref:Uncharacterized protein n=1 Tax=Vibrio orientalis CIP 102891 = ATCC 33934 TaxID=675816 RepID=F9SS99_VIBOR|nr:hypothetical protein [Vibrio orientalis]EGU51049.1 hypothetical protein VIOR3934_11272 [Vibrio orientalis CIP 102891 = ATCC 33934]
MNPHACYTPPTHEFINEPSVGGGYSALKALLDIAKQHAYITNAAAKAGLKKRLALAISNDG